VLAALSEAGYIWLYSLGDLGGEIVSHIALYLTLSIFYVSAVFVITRTATPSTGHRQLIGLIWAAAVLFRLTVVSLSPTLSEDLTRYRWQGKLQAAGGNPYTAVPEDPQWAALRDSTWDQVNRKDLPSVYGPLLETVYAAWYRLVSAVTPDEALQVWLFKIPFALCDLLAAGALIWLLKSLALPAAWVLVYLWSPLMVVEFWAQGHNDTLAILLLVLALAAVHRDHWTAGFSCLSLAALAKFWPAILFPFFLLRRENGVWRLRWKQALVAVPIALAVSWPYLQGIGQVSELLEGFLGGWRNNDSLYEYLWEYAGRNYDQGTTYASYALAAALAGIWALQLPLVRACQWAIVALLFVSANCFPWYLSWLVPLLAITHEAPLLLWTALVALAYHILIGYRLTGEWTDSDFVRTLEYVPVFGLLAARWIYIAARRAVQRIKTQTSERSSSDPKPAPAHQFRR
jgi:hypothetical protein